jgi:replicative DNA helicase
MSEAIFEQQSGEPDSPTFRHRPSNVPKIDRLPPHSIEGEQGVLGCIMLSPKDCIGESIEKLTAGPEMFFDLRHQTLYQALVEMYDESTHIDLITLQQRLKDRKLLDGVGGLAYLAALPDTVPTAAGMEYYIDIVVEKYLLRKMLQTCASISSRIYENEGWDVTELIDEAQRDVLAVTIDGGKTSTPPIRELMMRAIDRIEKMHENKGVIMGVPTGFVDFDKMTTGMHGGEMIVIAARPSLGKTSLAMNIAEHVALEGKIPVGVFSLEMTADQLSMRLLCSRARVNIRNITDGFMVERDFPKLTGAAGKLANSCIFIDDKCGLSIMQLRARARRMWQQHGIKLFVIDYLQLLHSTSRKAQNRQQEIADISNGIKTLSKELDVPILVLSQLNREIEKRGSGEPMLSDLRESGAIEQDADLVAFLYKVKTGEDEDGEFQDQEAVPVNLSIPKQRNGPTGRVSLTFLKSYTRFESAAKVSLEDVPMDKEVPKYDND